MDAEAQARALDALDRDILAASSQAPRKSVLHTVETALQDWGLQAWPPTRASWRALAASLKEGKYISAANYLSAYKVEGERRGYAADAWTRRAIADYSRSCIRGLGGPVKAAPLPMENLASLPASHTPVCPTGPLGPRNFVVVGTWWLTREVELSTARAA